MPRPAFLVVVDPPDDPRDIGRVIAVRWIAKRARHARANAAVVVHRLVRVFLAEPAGVGAARTRAHDGRLIAASRHLQMARSVLTARRLTGATRWLVAGALLRVGGYRTCRPVAAPTRRRAGAARQMEQSFSNRRGPLALPQPATRCAGGGGRVGQGAHEFFKRMGPAAVMHQLPGPSSSGG